VRLPLAACRAHRCCSMHQPDTATASCPPCLAPAPQATPNQPVTAAKQAMEEERGQTFTSATGKP
jgi:hypothetical protein